MLAVKPSLRLAVLLVDATLLKGLGSQVRQLSKF